MTNPAIIKDIVWHTYVGNDIAKILCQMCLFNWITMRVFDCSHVIAKSNGGQCTVENLRPLCSRCNSSMGTQNMLDFAKNHFPQSPLIPTLKKQNIEPILLEKKTRVLKTIQSLKKSHSKIESPLNRALDISEEIEGKVQCKDCLKYYTGKQSLSNHINRKRCKVVKKREVDENIRNIVREQVDQQLEELMKEVKELKQFKVKSV
jgi:uncharacterized CHY-type Zn-finger protein